MKRFLVLAAVAAATLCAATAAEAGRVDWSVGINLPAVSTYVSNGPAYYPAPAYGHRYYEPRRVYVEPGYQRSYAPVYVAPTEYAPVYAEPYYSGQYIAPRAYVEPAPVYLPRPARLWLPPLPPLPRLPPLPFFGHRDGDHDRDGRRDHDRDHDHDRVDYRR